MKLHETHFEEYVNQVKKINIHPYLEEIYKKYPSNLEDLPNLIYYGPQGSGKYSQMLYSIQKYSPSALKYEKKMCINYLNKSDYFLKISDIHYEVDMGILGCNAKTLFNEIYNQIMDSIGSKNPRMGIIVCKNFHLIHNELLEVFYYYTNNKNVTFILISEHLSFIPEVIINSSKIIEIPKPKKQMYKKAFQSKKTTHVSNLKILKNPKLQCVNNMNEECNTIVDLLLNVETSSSLDFLTLRENIYSLFINQYNIFDCLQFIIEKMVENKKLTENNITPFLFKLHNFFTLYNNNYRPIYHLESILLCLCRTIHEF